MQSLKTLQSFSKDQNFNEERVTLLRIHVEDN